MKKSRIEWTDATWNPIRGCTRVSEGCRNCYAERDAVRWSGEGQPYEGLAKQTSSGPKWTGKLSFPEHVMDQPIRWKKPRVIFVNSMSDLFHEEVPLIKINQIFETMFIANWHQFQVLTKRAHLMRDYSHRPPTLWANNIWAGTSIEDMKVIHRLKELQDTDAPLRFLSLEPLIGPLPNLDLNKIDWVIVGGESGSKCREMKEEWAIDIREQCREANVPFFFKQWGGKNKKDNGRLLEGQTYDEMPITLKKGEQH